MPYYTYIASNKWNTVLYTGVSGNLEKRSDEHAKKVHPGFTAKYNVNKILWYEVFSNPTEAISAEKKIKGWTRQKKFALIRNKNPRFEDLRYMNEGDKDSSPAGSE